MQKYKLSFKGQNIYVGIDVHLKTWHVTTLTESGCIVTGSGTWVWVPVPQR